MDSLAAPRWLRDLGFAAWLLVGALVLGVGPIWILALTAGLILAAPLTSAVARIAADLSSGGTEPQPAAAGPT